MMNPIVIRPVEARHMAKLHKINEEAAPGVGSLTREAFTQLIFDLADVVLVALQDDQPLGFGVCVIEGQTYGSLNYAWVSDNYVTFAYVDRIAVAPKARGLGVGTMLYEKIFHHYRGKRPVLVAEVNLQPPNPGSLRFHERMGFRNTGNERWEQDGNKGVVYLERSLLEFMA